MKDSIRVARLLNLIQAFREESTEKMLSQQGEAVLAYLLERSEIGLNTTVSKLVSSQLFGTPPTVQKKVDQLVHTKFLMLTRDTADSRKQNLVLTEKALGHLESLAFYISEKQPCLLHKS